MALLATEGQNIKLSATRFEMGRNFNNKLWNASRFVLMNIPEGEYEFDPAQLTDIKDRWIISTLNTTIKRCTELLEAYKYAETANLLYDFVWHSFCDWYVELAKADLNSDDPARQHLTRSILAHVLDRCLKMLHPMVPFITEELWQMLGKAVKNRFEGDTITLAPWPEHDDSLIVPAVEESFATLIDITRSIRNTRANLGIAERKPVSVVISAADAHRARIIADNQDYFRKMATVGEISVGVNLEIPKPSSADVVAGTQVFVMLDAADAEAEREKLLKRMAETEKFLKAIDAKLSNKNYIERAPEEIVAETRKKRDDLLEQKAIIARNLAALEG